MALILNIETASTNCSVSLSQEGEILVLKEDLSLQYSHAESLHVFIAEVLESAQIVPSQMTAIAVSKGPGSYTGLRIGVSAAKGLCFALGIPLIAIETLESLARQVSTDQGVIIPMLDARRMEVYAAVYAPNYQQIRATEAQILEASSFKTYLEQGNVYFIGSGVEKLESLIAHPNAVFIEDKLPSAAQMAILSYERYVNGNFEDVAYFEPYYLKEFIGTKP